MNKFYDGDGGDTILTGVGENIFYFTGPTDPDLGPTSIDILTKYDEFVFFNACNESVTVVPIQEDLDLFDGGDDPRFYAGKWSVEINAD